MALLPRVAVGTIQSHADSQPILWAILERLRQQGLQVQCFLSRGHFAHFHGEAAATGLRPRHLDSWLMSPERCRETFIRGAIGSDLAVVEGRYEEGGLNGSQPGGSLDRLCDWLDLPRIVVLDATRCDDGLPPRPAACDAVVIDLATDSRRLAELSARVESRWAVPVLAGLEALPHVRAMLRAVAPGVRPPLEIVERLGAALASRCDLDGLLRLSMRRPLAWIPQRPAGHEEFLAPITVALAYDKAFDCYFPDTLDGLESLGARLIDFSPRRDERLPADVDVVYFGCGHPERFADDLSRNHCMKVALRNFVRRGGRLYAEGGGLAYLCQELELPDGQLARMAGVFPAIARRRPAAVASPSPMEVVLDEPTWLGGAGTVLRGYRNAAWYLEAAGPLSCCGDRSVQRFTVVRNYRAVGSVLHVDFAAAPHILRRFFQTHLPAPCVTDPWAVV